VSILPVIFWRQQISWSYCATSRWFSLWHDAMQR